MYDHKCRKMSYLYLIFMVYHGFIIHGFVVLVGMTLSIHYAVSVDYRQELNLFPVKNRGEFQAVD
jgi:hypothetical protein